MKPAVVAGVPPMTAWLTVGWWWYLLTCGLATSAAELVSIDVVNSARCHVRCLSLIQVNIFSMFVVVLLFVAYINAAKH